MNVAKTPATRTPASSSRRIHTVRTHAASHRTPGSRAHGTAAAHHHEEVAPAAPNNSATSKRELLLSLTAAACSLAAGAGSARADPGGGAPRGILAEQEERLVRLRGEEEAKAQGSLLGRLCATPYGVDIVGITEFLAIVGALVGGITAKQRKMELEKLNEQLRKINLGLRQQARAGTVYAPGLSYAPAPATNSGSDSHDGPRTSSRPAMPRPPLPLPHKGLSPHAPARTAVATAAATTAVLAPAPAFVVPAGVSLVSTEEEEMSAEQLQCRDALRAGKRLLKDRNGAAAMVRFEKALMLCKGTGDKVQERRAMRGLAAAARLQGQHRSAIKHLERVLEISNQMGEHTGDADAYGTIADCYTDMGEWQKAAFYYDRYIERLNGPDASVI